MKVRAKFSMINSYTKETYIAIVRFNTIEAAYAHAEMRPVWQEWKLLELTIEERQ